MSVKYSFSVVIPALNEGAQIADLLSFLSGLDPRPELIICDGGSSDNTVELSSKFAKVVRSPKGRATQMNVAAKLATGDVLWFVHADCRPHIDSILAMQQVLQDPSVVGGGFEYSFDDPRWFFRVAEYCSNWKNHALGLLYGDMGIFVRKDVFVSFGGYNEIPLMEDMDICRKMKAAGKIVIVPRTIRTSARRWRTQGIVVTVVRNWLLQSAWALGVSPRILYRHYERK
jgi:rSAM/selenodomain-associated transferase 2